VSFRCRLLALSDVPQATPMSVADPSRQKIA
jgi:hypothetical protein